MALDIPTVTVDDLRAFHAKHYPSAPEPEHFLHGVESVPEAVEEYDEADDDGLGYYSDGVKRTLTDEQIAMFRHSEIQAILRKRRQQREDGEVSDQGGPSASPVSALGTPVSPFIGPVTPDAVTIPGQSVPSLVESTDTVQSGRVEKPKTQQWATSSARTKARNKKHNKNYRRKKKEDRKKREAREDGDDESDEWDPWHQANGPDVQKDDTVDLDY
ncbi:Nn.00g057460.m01.CDS01 [Neocucurbitaria sp. VM-36]